MGGQIDVRKGVCSLQVPYGEEPSAPAYVRKRGQLFGRRERVGVDGRLIVLAAVVTFVEDPVLLR